MELIDWLVEHLAVAALAAFAYWCVRERLWTALEPRLLRWRVYHHIKSTIPNPRCRIALSTQ